MQDDSQVARDESYIRVLLANKLKMLIIFTGQEDQDENPSVHCM